MLKAGNRFWFSDVMLASSNHYRIPVASDGYVQDDARNSTS